MAAGGLAVVGTAYATGILKNPLPALASVGQSVWDSIALAGATNDEKSIRSLEKRLEEHRRKLDDYRQDPDAYDNQGFLENAPSLEVRNRIIEGRIKHLGQEIRNFEEQIERLRGGGCK